MTGYDAVVVGARIGGAPTAMLLARAGARVALVDRGRYGSDALSTHGLMRAGVLQLSRWGLLDEIVAAGTPPIHRTTFHVEGSEPMQISIRSSPGVEALYAPRRYLIDRVLVDAAARAGVDVLHETRVDSLLRHPTGRVAGVRVEQAGQARELPARFVVGADGVGSLLARSVGASTLHRGRWASAIRYAYFSDIEPTGYEWAYGDGAAAGIIPTNDGLACVFVGTTPQRMRTLRLGAADDAVMATLFTLAAPGLAARFAAAKRTTRVHGWAGVRGFVRQSWGPGWALVGDAGLYTDPISTHGMTQALRDAELVSARILEALSGARPEGDALEAYQRQRGELSARLLHASDAIAAYDWDGARVQPLLRRVSAAMTDEVELLESLPLGPFAAATGQGSAGPSGRR